MKNATKKKTMKPLSAVPAPTPKRTSEPPESGTHIQGDRRVQVLFDLAANGMGSSENQSPFAFTTGALRCVADDLEAIHLAMVGAEGFVTDTGLSVERALEMIWRIAERARAAEEIAMMWEKSERKEAAE